jgi:hypothetical protein
VPLSFDWDGVSLLVATPADSPTGRNLVANPTVRLALGHTRDVTIIDGDVVACEMERLPRERRERFVARTGWDPGAERSSRYLWFLVTPRRAQAWREVDELPGRELMRDGRWTV